MKKLALALAFASVTLATPAMASFVVDTGTPVATPASLRYVLDSGQSLAGFFTLNSATTIRSVEGFINGSGSAGTVSIYYNSTFFFGPPVYSANFTTSGPGSSWQGVYGQNWALGAGSYWAAFSSTGFNSMLNTAPSPLSNYAFTNLGSWYSFPALNAGIRIADATTAAVPEPATWAMLLFGFAGIGTMMRRRQTVRATITA
jgi:PEP-CTERM motif